MMTNNKYYVWVVHIKTNTGNNYYDVYNFKPDIHDILKDIISMEDGKEPFSYYETNYIVHMECCPIRKWEGSQNE